MGELVYMFASLAARHQDGVACLEGMRLLADTLHPHGVPITWIVSGESARLAQQALTQWHDEHGDAVAVYTPELHGTLEDKKALMAAERDAVAAALPWAELTIAAGGHQDAQIAAVLEDLGFEGLWGFCWEQIDVDQITDRGCPWGFYYMNRGQRLAPAEGRGVIGMEWTARDLLKSFHSGNPCLYSTDPNDVARGGLCSWDDIDYWKSMADNYLHNTRYNEHVFLLQHQEAHEMQREPWRCYTDEDIGESAVMLEEFVRYIKGKARMMTLPKAARLYGAAHNATSSSFMLWNDADTKPHNKDYAWNIAIGPWPKTFLHCDRGAQIIFIEGKVEPVCIRNYARPWKAGEYFAEPDIPHARLVRNTQHGWSREVELEVAAPRPMPYGLALWGDYSLYQIADAPGLVEGKILSHELLFLRYDLADGDNGIKVFLEGK